MNEDMEESVGKYQGNIGGGPSLMVCIPKGTRIRGRCNEIQRPRMDYVDDPNKVLHARFQSTIPTEKILAMTSFDEEGAYPQKRKIISWAFESHIVEPEFEVIQGALMEVLESKQTNLLVNTQQLSDEQVCNALNKVSIKIEAKLFGRNERVKFLEAELVKKDEELLERTKELKHEELVSTQLRRELNKEKVRVREVSKKVEMITSAICLKHPKLTPPTQKYESSLQYLEDLTHVLTIERRRLTYADHTASGRCLYNIENYILENVLPYYGNTHTDDSFVGHRTSKMVHEAAKYIKQCMGGSVEDVLLFCGSGTTAAIKRLQEMMGIAVPFIMKARLRRGLTPNENWVVFVGPYEHHSNLLSWRQSLAQVVEINATKDGLINMTMLKCALEDPLYKMRPKLGSFSACSNVTGISVDTRALARLLHEHGAFACFDFAASGPYSNIDMRCGEMEGYDAVYVSPHKFIGGPGTPGILLMSKNLYIINNQPPSTCGGGTVRYVNGFNEEDTLYYEEVEERENAGTPPIIQICKAVLAFWIKEFMGSNLIESREEFFIQTAMRRLSTNPNIHILGNTTVKRQPVLSFLLYTKKLEMDEQREEIKEALYTWKETTPQRGKPLQGRFVTKLLNDLFGIQARGGCACAGPYGHFLLQVDEAQSLAFRSIIKKGYNGLKPGWTRLSFAYYISDEEFEFIISAIEFLAEYGQRFLVLYDFNWKTGEWSINQKVLDKIQNHGALTIFNTKLDQIVYGREDVQQKYRIYMAEAKQVAKLLPKFPKERHVPNDVDTDLLLYMV
ncbi:hypothetical protein KI387_011066 [Taxus chinensis]|uniref:Aminotransferase class V domain-containing protein n=1 Tax=Taxus chinensis TaxID=29808 RepID=A0AA38FLS2_TAXCH|nr:hypothetical protein KI387_011066 [Taxus chinensis]